MEVHAAGSVCVRSQRFYAAGSHSEVTVWPSAQNLQGPIFVTGPSPSNGTHSHYRAGGGHGRQISCVCVVIYIGA